MLLTNVASVAVVLALLAQPGAQPEQRGSSPKDSGRKEDPLEQKDRAAVEKWIHHLSAAEAANAQRAPVKSDTNALPGPEKTYIEPVQCTATRRLIPDERYYRVHFMQYPRSGMLPPTLAPNNLVRVRSDGSVERIEDLEKLKKLYAAKLPPVRDEAQARAAAQGFLALAVEFLHHGRGRYTFDIPEEGVVASRQGDGCTATAKAVVTQGGEGQVTATLTFDASGKLKPDAIKINTRLRALPGGRRP